MIVSEEWLATGKFEASWSSAALHGVNKGTRAEAAKFEQMILRRQCVDLRSEPLALHIPTGTLFSEAYDKYLADRFSKLVRESFYLPRIVLSEADQPEIALNLLTALNERYFRLLENEAVRVNGGFNLTWRTFTRRQFEAGHLIFLKFMGFSCDPARLRDLEWLRRAVTESDATLGPLHGEAESVPAAPPVSVGRSAPLVASLKK